MWLLITLRLAEITLTVWLCRGCYFQLGTLAAKIDAGKTPRQKAAPRAKDLSRCFLPEPAGGGPTTAPLKDAPQGRAEEPSPVYAARLSPLSFQDSCGRAEIPPAGRPSEERPRRPLALPGAPSPPPQESSTEPHPADSSPSPLPLEPDPAPRRLRPSSRAPPGRSQSLFCATRGDQVVVGVAPYLGRSLWGGFPPSQGRSSAPGDRARSLFIRPPPAGQCVAALDLGPSFAWQQATAAYQLDSLVGTLCALRLPPASRVEWLYSPSGSRLTDAASPSPAPSPLKGSVRPAGGRARDRSGSRPRPRRPAVKGGRRHLLASVLRCHPVRTHQEGVYTSAALVFLLVALCRVGGQAVAAGRLVWGSAGALRCPALLTAASPWRAGGGASALHSLFPCGDSASLFVLFYLLHALMRSAGSSLAPPGGAGYPRSHPAAALLVLALGATEACVEVGLGPPPAGWVYFAGTAAPLLVLFPLHALFLCRLSLHVHRTEREVRAFMTPPVRGYRTCPSVQMSLARRMLCRVWCLLALHCVQAGVGVWGFWSGSWEGWFAPSGAVCWSGWFLLARELGRALLWGLLVRTIGVYRPAA